MELTTELRWFNRGSLPQEITYWFQQADLGEQLGQQEERQDLYLYLAGCDYLGIKLRQERLEIKWRQAEVGVAHFGDSVEGKTEKWGKWLCEDPTAETFQPKAVVGKDSWVSVKKVRSQRHYQVLEGAVIAVPVTESIAQGCTVELTELDIEGNAWWSIAFEAFGKANCLMENLQSVADWVFKSYQSRRLPIKNSYSYPEWLCLVTQD